LQVTGNQEKEKLVQNVPALPAVVRRFSALDPRIGVFGLF
jgi:hypothetical protein